MSKKGRTFFQYLLFLGLGIFLVWFSLRQIPDDRWEAFELALRNARYGLMLPVFLILSASHVLRAMRWKILMKPMGYQPALPNVFFAVMIGYLANLAVPRLGEVLKCTLLARYEKVPADRLVGTILVERAFDVVCLGLVFLLAFGLEYEVVGLYARQLLGKAFPAGPGGYLFMKLLLGLVVLVLVARWAWILLRQWKHVKGIATVMGIVSGIGQGLNSIRQLKEKGLFLLYSLGIWGLYVLGTWVGLQATQGTAGLGWSTAVSALAFASIGMIITPGGIGAYAFFLAKVLALHEVPIELGMANGTLQWFAQFGIVLLVGFACLGLLPLYNKNKKDESHRRFAP